MSVLYVILLAAIAETNAVLIHKYPAEILVPSAVYPLQLSIGVISRIKEFLDHNISNNSFLRNSAAHHTDQLHKLENQLLTSLTVLNQFKTTRPKRGIYSWMGIASTEQISDINNHVKDLELHETSVQNRINMISHRANEITSFINSLAAAETKTMVALLNALIEEQHETLSLYRIMTAQQLLQHSQDVIMSLQNRQLTGYLTGPPGFHVSSISSYTFDSDTLLLRAHVTELTTINEPIRLHPTRACCYVTLHHLVTAVDCKTSVTLSLFQRFETFSNSSCPLASVPTSFLNMTGYTCTMVGDTEVSTYCSSNLSSTVFGFQLIRSAASISRSVDAPADEVRGIPVNILNLPALPALTPEQLADLSLGNLQSPVPLFSRESGDTMLVVIIVMLCLIIVEMIVRYVWWLYPLCPRVQGAAGNK